MLSKLAVALLLLCVCGTAGAQDLGVREVLDNMIEAYGGKDNLRKLDAFVQHWEMVALMSKRHGTDVRSVHVPGRLKVELTYPDKQETRILNGNASHVIFNRQAPRQAAPPQHDAMRLQLMRLYSPLVLEDRAEALSLTVEGGLCALTLQEHGVQADYLVDMDSWRIEKVVGTLSINGTEMQFLTEYSDFRFHEGVLVHGKENKYAGQVNTAVLTLRDITLDASLADDVFEPR